MGEIFEHSSSFIFESIILILAGNEDMHESLDEFKFRPDTDTNTRVICPCASEKLLYNVVTTLAPSFLIGSSSRLLSSTISNMNISATSGPITMKFYQKHHCDAGKAALGFWPDQIGTLVTMTTESSHRLIMEKTVLPFSQLFFIQSFLYLQVMMTCMGAQRSSKFSQIGQPTAELAALERLKKSP